MSTKVIIQNTTNRINFILDPRTQPGEEVAYMGLRTAGWMEPGTIREVKSIDGQWLTTTKSECSHVSNFMNVHRLPDGRICLGRDPERLKGKVYSGQELFDRKAPNGLYERIAHSCSPFKHARRIDAGTILISSDGHEEIMLNSFGDSEWRLISEDPSVTIGV